MRKTIQGGFLHTRNLSKVNFYITLAMVLIAGSLIASYSLSAGWAILIFFASIIFMILAVTCYFSARRIS